MGDAFVAFFVGVGVGIVLGIIIFAVLSAMNINNEGRNITMIKISRFRSCTKTPPKKDGTYLVIRMWKGELSLALAMKYSLEYGWNADSWSHNSIVTFEESEHAMWATVTEEKQPRKVTKGDNYKR